MLARLAPIVAVLAPLPAARAQCTVTPLTVGVDDLGPAVSADGDTVLVGAPGDDGVCPWTSFCDSGAAYVFVRSGTGWVQDQRLVPIGVSQGDRFGQAVHLCGDLAILGAPGDGDAGTESGSAYVFERVGSQWLQDQELAIPAPAPDELYGTAVAIGADVALVGAPEHDAPGAADAGAVHVFERQAGVWVHVGELLPPDPAPVAWFGYSVALSGDVAVVGAPADDDVGTDSGSAWVFERAGTVWTQTAELDPVDGFAFDYFGISVAARGAEVLVGAMQGDGVAFNSGSTYVFEKLGSAWTQTAELTASDAGTLDRFGLAVALADDRIAVGQVRDWNVLPMEAGATYVFERQGSAWQETAKLQSPSPSPFSLFGQSVSLSGDRLLVGDVAAPPLGGAFVLELGEPAAYCTAKPNSQGCVPQICAFGQPSASDPSAFSVVATAVLNNKNGLLFYGLAGPAAAPFLGGTLCVAPPLRRTPPQNAGGNPPPDDCTGSYVFDFNAWVQGGNDPNVAPGVEVRAQYWTRDPASADGTGAGLTDALGLVFCD